MKKYIFALLLCAGFALPALGQSNPPLRLQEIDGTPNVLGVTTIKVTNGTLSCSGKVCTITISGGGGGSPGGSNTQVQYNAAGSFGGVAGFTFNGTSTISLGVAGTSVGAIGFRNATSGTITLQPVTGALGTVTLSLPAVTDTLVGLAATQTLTNKTLTTPVIAQISNTGTLTLPTSTDTLVGRATTDTLTNKTLSTSNTVSAALTWTAGVKQTFAPNGTNAGINVGSVAGDPSAPANGDLWYDSTANELTARINGANVALGGGGGSGITIGTTTITSGTNTRVLYNNAGVVGEYAVTGTGNAVLSESPTLTGRLTGADANFATAVTTGTGATAGFQVTANSLTTGNGVEVSSSSVSSGNAVSIAATGTAAASNTKTALNVSTSGANATSTQTTYGARVSNTSTGTSSTNYGIQSTASGGSTNVPFMASTGSTSTSVAFYAVGAENGTGVYYPSGSQLGLGAGGTERLRLNATGITVHTALNFGSAASSFDTTIRRNAAAHLTFGAADAASPVAQTLSVQNVVGGTSNTAGANWTLAGSRGTGTGVGGDIIFQTAPAGGSGTSQNALAAAFTVKGDGAVQLKSVTFANLPSVANGYLIYCSDCTIASPCASGGSGAVAKGINGAWVCN